MDIVLTVLPYLAGGLVLLVLILFLIGLASGLIDSARAWKEVKNSDDSEVLAEIEVRRQAFQASRGIHGDDDATMARVAYPSRQFENVTGRLLEGGHRFIVSVAARSRKRAAVERELPAMVFSRSRQERILCDFADKLRTMGLWKCVATAILHYRYLVIYDVAADITIRFEPKPPPEQQ